jgi:hypothetical protein
MPESDSPLMTQKSCVVQAIRRERNIALQVYYDVRDEDGCKIYTLAQVVELKS